MSDFRKDLGSQERRSVEFERRLAWLQLKQGRYTLAEETYEHCIEQMDGAAYHHPYGTAAI
ncbi:MAG: hypothetical protein K2W95_04550 [Candidatus Obscuribacterales bacterium]|nr:hypothetical protein [Candidatus Obscuribacterales bacterium]